MRPESCSRSVRVVLTFIFVVLVIGRSPTGESRLAEKLKKRNETTSLTTRDGLYWSNLSVGTEDGSTVLLHDFSGGVENGHVCGILGPSGAGKSTTLSALGGTISRSSRLKVQGKVFYQNNGFPNKKSLLNIKGGRVAWMQQEDNFFDMLTVQETLELAAFLELPMHSETERKQQVTSILESLGLAKLNDRKIGNSASHNGLSGGEKRRLSLALELISAPKLFLADEPSSGLDSTMSKKVVSLIKKMVQQRHIPCIVSLHQPQSSVFKMLDSLILLGPGGYVCYHGKTSEALSYFERLGFSCPEQTNPAEFLLDLVSIDSEDPSQARKDELRISELAKSFAESQRSLENSLSRKLETTATMKAVDIKKTDNTPSGERRRKQWFRPLRRFGRLLLRSWRQNIRNHRTNSFRLFVSCGNAYLFSRIFHSIKKGIFTAKSVADRVAVLSFAVINMSMMALMKTIDLFAKEKPVVHREQQRHQYTNLEYLMAKTIAEIPIDTVFAAIFTSGLKHFCGLRIGLKALTGVFTLMTVAGATLGFAIGALSPTGEIAVVAGIPVMIVMMTVGIINPAGVDKSESQPLMVRTLKELSPIAFAIKALCLAEYRGAEFEDLKHDEKQNNFLRVLGRSRRVLKDLPKMGALALVQNGDQVLNELGMENDRYEGAMKRLAILSIGNLVISWIGLKLNANPIDSFSDARSVVETRSEI